MSKPIGFLIIPNANTDFIKKIANQIEKLNTGVQFVITDQKIEFIDKDELKRLLK